MTNNNYFIKVFNTFITGDFKLSVDELYVYNYLYTKRTYEEEVETSIDVLASKIKLSASARYNKDNIKKALERLAELLIIDIEEDGKALTITFNEFDALEEKGFTKVEYAKVKELSPVELYIYTAVKKWEDNPKTGKARYAYSQWANLLGCSDKSAFTYVTEAVKKGIIFKQTGKRKENAQQENNIYSIDPEFAPVHVTEEPQEAIAEEDVTVVSNTEPVQEPERINHTPEEADNEAKKILTNAFDGMSMFAELEAELAKNAEERRQRGQ